VFTSNSLSLKDCRFCLEMAKRGALLWDKVRSTAVDAPGLFAEAIRRLDEAHLARLPTSPALPKTMHDSTCRLLLPFATDLNLRNAFVNHLQQLRKGMLLGEMDAFAGISAALHCAGAASSDGRPPVLVTGACDRIYIRPELDTIGVGADCQLIAAVTHVGTSSVTVSMDLATTSTSTARPSVLLTAYFTMVARDRATNRALQVPRLLCLDEREKKVFIASFVRANLVSCGDRDRHCGCVRRCLPRVIGNGRNAKKRRLSRWTVPRRMRMSWRWCVGPATPRA